MSHIMGFRIGGLTGRDEVLDIKLNRDDNIFFGLNGSGKTSLLKILHSAMARDSSILINVPFKFAEVDIYSIDYKRCLTFSIKKNDPKDQNNLSSNPKTLEFPILLNGMGSSLGEWMCNEKINLKSGGWRHRFLTTTRLHVNEQYVPHMESDGRQLLKSAEEKLNTFFTNSIEYLWSSYSASVLGEVRQAQDQGLGSILKAVISSDGTKKRKNQTKVASDIAYEILKRFLTRQGSEKILGARDSFFQNYKSNIILQGIVQDIDEVEGKIKLAMASRNKLQELILNLFSGNKDINFTDNSIEVKAFNGEKINLGYLSSGEKHLILILVESLLAKEDTIIIDEPELSIHIDWQIRLIESMRALNSKAQFIFATHSPEIMTYIREDKIFKI